ncbi:EcKinase, DUF1679, APH and/or Choline kinase domain containing protein [Asbolus verrucosus]|uniref:EcKinase, DUF1679, APH and/or Choline kinase domain containing protein n=1 Tax=Asbolus verrucosus TaxID=1661398 RepID=A0A482W372_ASBVE|nr:EcKinase, DUF1679, APH and/or Choline kinase domain containing protein [Asbolus verrucosus]
MPKINQILFNDFRKTIPQFDPKITPKLYYGKSDLWLFEDLTWQGFETCKFQVFSLDQVRVVLRVLAKFHAGSFAYEEIKSEKLGKKYRLDEEYKLVYSNINLQKTEVNTLISSLFEDGNQKTISEDLEERQNSRKCRKTLCHSNLLPENIMFRYENGIPVDCKLINFKSKHYAPPIYDVLQLIFFNTGEHLRQHHLETLIINYYEYLKKELDKYCLKIEDILTIENLHASASHILPLIKLETILRCTQGNNSIEEFKEIISCPILTREDCYIIVKNKIGTTNYKFLSFTVTPLDQVNGYLGDYHKLQIKIIYNSEDKTINCFIKRMPKGVTSKEIVEETGCFFKEVFVYQTLVPMMHQLGISAIDSCLASCYFQRSEDVIVFDDVSLNNYRTLSTEDPFDFHLLSLAVKKVAKFHASMMMFEEKMSEKLGKVYQMNEEYSSYVHEIFFLKDETHGGAKVMQIGVKSIIDVADLFPEIKTETNQKHFKKLWPKLQELFYKLIQTSDKFRNVLSHGDLWTNNIMVQFEGDEAVDCCFVDFQNTRYCPPAHDFLSVLYLTTNRANRMKHEKELQDIYYNELTHILSLYDFEINKIYPYEEFVETVSYMRPQMVMQAIMYSSFMCSSGDIASFLVNDDICRYVFFEDRKEYLAKMCEKSTVFKMKLKECILDLYELCDFMACSF